MQIKVFELSLEKLKNGAAFLPTPFPIWLSTWGRNVINRIHLDQLLQNFHFFSSVFLHLFSLYSAFCLSLAIKNMEVPMLCCSVNSAQWQPLHPISLQFLSCSLETDFHWLYEKPIQLVALQTLLTWFLLFSPLLLLSISSLHSSLFLSLISHIWDCKLSMDFPATSHFHSSEISPSWTFSYCLSLSIS